MNCCLGRRVNDGLWHTVSLVSRNLQITLSLDGEPSSNIELWESVESRGSFYFGGCPPTECHMQAPAFQGCMQLISINNHLVNLTHVQQGLLGNYNELQFDTCNMKDRDKQADWIFQLKCNRNSAAPSLAEDYANKLFPTVLCGMLSLIILHSCGLWQTYELHKRLHAEGNIYRSEANMQTATFPCAYPDAESAGYNDCLIIFHLPVTLIKGGPVFSVHMGRDIHLAWVQLHTVV
ncbi:hypothetical protein AMECASPLE_005528 [Ameca splendens]|uniref:Laminin G domain-containing protein n=1 Tax=Ameca splendens TaxID=208324 RepID=A0ABV0ZKA1_9TELE